MDELALIRTDTWGPLFKRYNQYVLACCEFNEDMAQEIWIRIVLKKDQFFYGSFKSWISTIANSVKVDAYRKNRSKNPENIKCQRIKEYPMDSPFMAKVFGDIPDDFPIRKEEKQEVEEKLLSVCQEVDKLPEKQRDVTILRSYKTFAEISGIMNDSINTTLGHMRYAKKKLQKAFKNQTIAA